MSNRPDKSVKLYPLFSTSRSGNDNNRVIASKATTARTHTKTGHHHHRHHHHQQEEQQQQQEEQQQQQHGHGETDRESSDNDEIDDDDDDDDLPLMSLATAMSSRSARATTTTTRTTMMKKRQLSVVQEGLENRDYDVGGNKQSRTKNHLKTSSRERLVEEKIQTCCDSDDGNPLTEEGSEAQLLMATSESSSKPNSSPKRRLMGRRIYSDSAMDFVPPRTVNTTTRGRLITTALVRRSESGGPLSTNKRMSPSKGMWPKKWAIPSWVSLESPTTVSQFGSANGSRSIDCMAWDPMGVLLAVSTGKLVSIYDWDMIRAADMQGRSDRARGCHESEWKIAPIIRFRVPDPVASLVWNPFNVDELAVGFRVSGLIQIFDVDRVARWLSNEGDSGVISPRFPPQKTYRSLAVPGINGNVSDVVFLTSDHVTASIGTMIVCWKLPSLVVWRFRPPSSVTSMAPLGSNLIVVGTNQGHLSILNWTIHTKERSFSNERRPLVLQTWIPHATLKMTRDDSRLRMGILKLRIERRTCIGADSVAGDEHWGICRLTWVTQSGWLLSTTFESPSRRGCCSVHHATPKVVYQNSDGQPITTDRQSWSLPQEPVGVHLSDSAVCLSEVPAVTSILSHHDKFVLDSQPCSIRSSKRAILIRSRHDEALNSISLPTCIKKVPQTLAIHQSLEWIVLGEGEKLHILVGRDCKYKESNRGGMRL